jgi:hypothetical protein
VAQHELQNQTQTTGGRNPTQTNRTLTHVSKRSKHAPGLAINSNEGTRRFFPLVAPWHRGFHEGVELAFLLCLMHLDANLVKHLGRTNASVSSTDVLSIRERRMVNSFAFGYAPTGRFACKRTISSRL